MTRTDSNCECTKPSAFLEYYKVGIGHRTKLFRSKINALNYLAKNIEDFKYAPTSEKSTVVLTATITRHELSFFDSFD